MNKTALITGASSSVGSAIAQGLASAGFNLGLHYYSQNEPVEKVAGEAEKYGVSVQRLRYDLTELEQVEALVDEFISSNGKLDVLVNTIGPFYSRDILDVTPCQWREAIDLNLNITFNVTYLAKNYICRSQGHIINFGFSGVENLKAWPTSTGYCAAKAGVIVLTKSLAVALAKFKVRVNAVCPGLVFEGLTSEPERIKMEQQIPFGRPAQPTEIASLVKWLVTESPDYLTGSVIPIAGAWEY